MVRPKKHLGQHFLKNEATAARIASALSGEGYDQILEVGPGMGILTQHLLKRPETLYVAEIDVESIHYLEEHFPDLRNQILKGDFLHMPLEQVFNDSVAIVGNFPYNISSQIIFKMLENLEKIPEMAGMFQKEVADRLVAPPGSKTYGILSVLCDAWFEREKLFTVEAQEFKPPPKVRSAVIRLKRKQSFALDCDPIVFKRVVKTAFNQRRKTLRNALKPLNLPLDGIDDSLLANRAEQLSYQDFEKMTRIITS